MNIEQISVFIENKEGRLAEVTGILAKAEINLRGLSIADTSDFGILRLIVNDVAKAEKALKAENFTVGKTNVIAVEILDTPGGLHKILQIIQENDINVEYMYAIMIHTKSSAIMVFRFDDLQKAEKILKKNNLKIISNKDLI